MGIQREYDSGVPIGYAFQYLDANADFRAMWGEGDEQALYERVRIPPDPPKSYVLVKATQVDVKLWAGASEYISDLTAIIEVINVRIYPFGTGSEMHFRQPLKILRRALCGNIGVQVFDLETGELMGDVDESSFLSEIPLTKASRGDFDTLQKGIRLRLVWR